MGTVLVVVPLVLTQRVSKMGLGPDQCAVQKLAAQRLDPAFHDRVHAGHPDAGQDRRDPDAAEDLVDQCRVLAVAVANEEPDPHDTSGVLEVHEQVSDRLGDPDMDGVRGRADYPYTATGVVDDGENVLALAGQRDHLDEVHRQDRLRLRAQEVDPGNGCPARGRIDAGSLEDLPHRRGGDRDTHERELTVGTSISPRRVLSRQP